MDWTIEELSQGGLLVFGAIVLTLLVVAIVKAVRYASREMFNTETGYVPRYFKSQMELSAVLQNESKKQTAKMEEIVTISERQAGDLSALAVLHTLEDTPFATTKLQESQPLLADALLAGTPDDKRSDVEPLVEEIKQIFET